MPKREESKLNNTGNRGFEWMLDSESNNKQKEESVFSYRFKKFISFLYERIKFLINYPR